MQNRGLSKDCLTRKNLKKRCDDKKKENTLLNIYKGHIIFVILHLLAILFGLVGLIVTIPLHIIYAAVVKQGRRSDGEQKGQPIDKGHGLNAKEDRFQCLLCSKRYMSRDNLVTHLRTSHKVSATEIDQQIYDITDAVKDCPFCRKKIDKEAIKCPYCQEWVANAKEKTKVKGSDPV